ncbi:MAG: Fe-S cluster assembly protein SufD [Bacteroidetes bacterium]|nr:Fe-S cluster assembly protein SufD [Bacteroidota bacterium]
MSTIEQLNEKMESLQQMEDGSSLKTLRHEAFSEFRKNGVPTTRHEEWKYTRLGGIMNKDYNFSLDRHSISKEDFDAYRLPGYEEANELVFINGFYSGEMSKIISEELVVMPLERAAAGEYENIITTYLGHSRNYLVDGINAMNTALMHDGVFVFCKKNADTKHPVYIYNIQDARSSNVFSQPRSLIYVSQNAKMQIVETYITIGQSESFTNQVMEVVTMQDARIEYYKIQKDHVQTNAVSTTHIIQQERGFAHAVTISMDGGIVRNNLNFIMCADHGESHMYGLYFLQCNTHADNHTIVDNIRPNCLSNQLYKGILSGHSTGVFNGKIFVRQAAQKTNAYQSNKNILMSDTATVNAKPQLEIFADDVKCSHGCTVGHLDDEGLFYLQSRGIPETKARALLIHAFAMDILEQIYLDPIRKYIDQEISERLENE